MIKEENDSILITLSQRTIKERKGGFKGIVKEWLRSDGEPGTWCYKSGTSPKNPENINWVFWVIGGRIRWKCKLLTIHKNQELYFEGNKGGVQKLFAKRWFELFDFEPIPKSMQLEKKGFQGFRYFNSDLIDCV